MLDRGEHGERTVRFDAGNADIYTELDRYGHMPLPPYIHRDDSETDRTRYNTVYAAVTGSVAAPTAGLHFTPEILEAVQAKGASVASVTLHVGLGTFAPLHAETTEEVRLHGERYRGVRFRYRNDPGGPTSHRGRHNCSEDARDSL